MNMECFVNELESQLRRRLDTMPVDSPRCGPLFDVLMAVTAAKKAATTKREITSFGQGMLDDVMAEPPDQPGDKHGT